jgi:hypothetical protein
MTVAQLPVACSLTDPELRERRSGVLARLAEAVQARRELADGLAFRFAPESATLALLAEVIDLERQCCPFLRFQLTLEPGGGPVWLELTGPEGTKDFLAELFPR